MVRKCTAFQTLLTARDRFNLSTTQTELSSQRSAEIVSTLQAIIKPFLLRRLKIDVEKDSIPPKKEYLIYAPLTETQREIYDAIVDGGLRSYLMSGKKDKQQKAVEVDDGPMKLRSAKYKSGKTKQAAFDVLDGDDDEYFKLLESGQLDEKTKRKKEEDLSELGRRHQLQAKGVFSVPRPPRFA
jgi:ATP-dependent DNA helicase